MERNTFFLPFTISILLSCSAAFAANPPPEYMRLIAHGDSNAFTEYFSSYSGDKSVLLQDSVLAAAVDAVKANSPAKRQRDGIHIVHFLVAKGARVFAKTDQATLLHRAAEGGPTELVQYFLDLGLSPDATSAGGFTPLVPAVSQPRQWKGKTAPDLALLSVYRANVQLLIEAGAHPDAQSNLGFPVQTFVTPYLQDVFRTTRRAYYQKLKEEAHQLARRKIGSLLDWTGSPVRPRDFRPDPVGQELSPLGSAASNRTSSGKQRLGFAPEEFEMLDRSNSIPAQ